MVVLATKCYVEGDARDRALDGMNSLVANDIGELDVDWQVGVPRRRLRAGGRERRGDAEVARNVLAETWGEIVAHDDGLEAGEEYVGTLESWDDDGFVLDAGVDVQIPADEIGLGRGSPEQVVERFGLVQHLSVRFVYGGDVGDPDAEPSRLSDAERDRLYDWQRGDGRLNVNSATRGEVRATVNRAGHAQDIITVERLGLLEQSVVCTEDTDPPGLLASIGSYLPAEMRCVV